MKSESVNVISNVTDQLFVINFRHLKLLLEQQRQYHNSLKPFRDNTIQNVSKFPHVETPYLEFFYFSSHPLLVLLEASYEPYHNINCFQRGVCNGMEESLCCSCIKLLHLSFVKAVIICLLVKQILPNLFCRFE